MLRSITRDGPMLLHAPFACYSSTIAHAVVQAEKICVFKVT
jgi:hypothetical protein